MKSSDDSCLPASDQAQVVNTTRRSMLRHPILLLLGCEHKLLNACSAILVRITYRGCHCLAMWQAWACWGALVLCTALLVPGCHQPGNPAHLPAGCADWAAGRFGSWRELLLGVTRTVTCSHVALRLLRPIGNAVAQRLLPSQQWRAAVADAAWRRSHVAGGADCGCCWPCALSSDEVTCC
jgi:hypothetical protein